MDEGTRKAIPLRRPRTRALTIRPPSWSQRIGAGVLQVLEPPRQIWLATLGVPGVLGRAALETWSMLIAEGLEVEATLGDVVRRRLGGDPPRRETATP
jgi:hypothetical protein